MRDIYVDTTRRGDLEITLDARSWHLAADAGLWCRENPPKGYEVNAIHIFERSRRGGRRASLRIILRSKHVNVQPMTSAEAQETFRLEQLIAVGQRDSASHTQSPPAA
jgi:hypothetical protein